MGGGIYFKWTNLFFNAQLSLNTNYKINYNYPYDRTWGVAYEQFLVKFNSQIFRSVFVCS